MTHSDSSGPGTNLVKKAIYAMVEGDCDEVSLIAGLTVLTHVISHVGYVRVCPEHFCKYSLLKSHNSHKSMLDRERQNSLTVVVTVTPDGCTPRCEGRHGHEKNRSGVTCLCRVQITDHRADVSDQQLLTEKYSNSDIMTKMQNTVQVGRLLQSDVPVFWSAGCLGD